MTTIWKVTRDALRVLDAPVAMNTYVGDRPDLYLVYQLIDGPAAQSADDGETLRAFRMQVSAWSTDGLANLPDIDGAMLQAGFKKGSMRELPRDPDSGHFGLAQDYIYLMTSEEMSQTEGAYS
jgi:hypothetical protein